MNTASAHWENYGSSNRETPFSRAFIKGGKKMNETTLSETTSAETTNSYSYELKEPTLNDLHNILISDLAIESKEINKKLSLVYSKLPMVSINVKSDFSENYLRKVGAFMLPHGLPTSFSLYFKEMSNSYVVNWKSKLGLTLVFTPMYKWLGGSLASLLLGILIFAIFDAVLSLIPGNVKEGRKKDHTLQSKFWALATNVLALTAIIKCKEYLMVYTGTFKGSGILSVGVTFAIAIWVFGIYASRIVGYIARANNTTVPVDVKKVLEKISTK